MGGSDDPSNLVFLTVAEHAEAHKKLYEEYGKYEDLFAWKGLSGQLGNEERLQERARLGGINANKKNACSLGGKANAEKWKNDKQFAERVREKLSKPKQNKEKYFGKKTLEHAENIRKAALKRERITCEKCGNGYTKANFNKHYVSCK